ncbi:MAG: OB-fold nucleic acid binding domain-containing protein, partial [Candidatus Latescibacteria bacterium]|nr:OB-fold nucleic acid binding domain-containing protein [Candidatus Latescibacterota bacterium]
WSERERLTREKEMLGFYLSGHPLEKHRTEMLCMGIRSVKDVAGLPDGAELKLGGMLTEVKPHTDRNSRPMAFGTLEDLEGAVDLVVFPDAFEKVREVFLPDSILVLNGRFSDRNGRTSVQVEQVLPIEAAREVLADAVNVYLPPEDLESGRMEALKEVLSRHTGKCTLYLHLQLGEDRRTVVRSRVLNVSPSEALDLEVSKLTGGRAKVWVSSEAEMARRGAGKMQAA